MELRGFCGHGVQVQGDAVQEAEGDAEGCEVSVFGDGKRDRAACAAARFFAWMRLRLIGALVFGILYSGKAVGVDVVQAAKSSRSAYFKSINVVYPSHDVKGLLPERQI